MNAALSLSVSCQVVSRRAHGVFDIKPDFFGNYAVDQRVIFLDQFSGNWLEETEEENTLARTIDETPTI